MSRVAGAGQWSQASAYPLPHPQLQIQRKGQADQETRKCEMLLSAEKKKGKQVFKEHKVSAKEVMGPLTLKSMASSMDSRRPSGEREMRKAGEAVSCGTAGWLGQAPHKPRPQHPLFPLRLILPSALCQETLLEGAALQRLVES